MLTFRPFLKLTSWSVAGSLDAILIDHTRYYKTERHTGSVRGHEYRRRRLQTSLYRVSGDKQLSRQTSATSDRHTTHTEYLYYTKPHEFHLFTKLSLLSKLTLNLQEQKYLPILPKKYLRTKIWVT